MAAKKKHRGVSAACAIVVEQSGSKRKVVSDMAEAKTLAKRLAERHPTKQVKITRACSTGRGARGETVGACTGRKCWGALSGVRGTRDEHAKKAQSLIDEARRIERGGKVRGGYNPKPHERKAYVADLMTRASENCMWAHPYAPADCELTTSRVALPSSGKSREDAAEARARAYDRKLRARKRLASDEDPYGMDGTPRTTKRWRMVEANGRVVGTYPGDTMEDAFFVMSETGVDFDEDGMTAHEVKSTKSKTKSKRARRSGIKGTVEQHEASARDYAAAARRALQHASETSDPKLRRTFLATAQKQIDAGQTECTWIPARGLEPKPCREVREAYEALWTMTKPARQRSNQRARRAARGMGDTSSARKPTKRQLDNAVTSLRLYMGSDGRCRMSDQQRLYNRFNKAMKPLRAFTIDADAQVGAEARRLGPIVPVPGKDI